jgi:hypothetical protein
MVEGNSNQQIAEVVEVAVRRAMAGFEQELAGINRELAEVQKSLILDRM